MSAPVSSEQRFTRSNPCPICGGYDGMPRDQGKRCFGFLSSDGKFAHCTREEHAGGLPLDNAGTYSHRLAATCRCGQMHGAAPWSPPRPPEPTRVHTEADFADCEAGSPWDFTDETGVMLYRKVRHPGKKFCFYHRNGVGWVKDRGGAAVLLDLPLVRQAIAAGRTIILAEGEKKARLLQGLGFAATSSDSGAKSFSADDVKCLRGARRVVVVLDNDPDGRARGNRVPPMLHEAGIHDVQTLLIPDLDEGEGVDDWLARRQEKPLEEVKRELEDLMRAAPLWEPSGPSDDAGAAEAVEPGAFHLTEFGNAARLVAAHGQDLRYCHQWRTWLVWDGRRWQRDTMGEVMHRAKGVLLDIYTEAARAPTPEKREALGKWAARCERERQVAAMVALAQADLPVLPAAFDADPWLLCVANGLLDLRSATLEPHRRDAMVTRLAPVPYVPGARDAVWDAFLERAVPDNDVRAFLQRAVGYTLTGDTGEEKLFFMHGPEASSKSSFAEGVRRAIGDFAAVADFEAFLRRRGDAGVRNDIARLAGARMVLSLEVDEGRSLAEGLVKNLTGGDTVSARFLHQEFFEFRPAFKLWLVANHRPKANAADGALWRRILLLPFTITIPEAERDPGVKRYLTTSPDAQAAILAWAVEGCLAWRREGLQPPDAVRQATADYRAECDSVADFLAELGTKAAITAKALRERYEAWCKENGERPVNSKRLAMTMRDHGAEPYRNNAAERCWRWPEAAEQALDLEG